MRKFLAAIACCGMLAACGDGSPTEANDTSLLPPSRAAGLSAAADEALDDSEGLRTVTQVMNLLNPGQCMFENRNPAGNFRRFRRRLRSYKKNEATTSFVIAAETTKGQVIYRAVCNVAVADREQAFNEMSWTRGDGDNPSGKGWPTELTLPSGLTGSAGPRGPQGAVLWGPSLGGASIGEWRVPSSFNWDPYDHYDYCIYVADSEGEPVYVLYCGYNEGGGCEPTQNLRLGQASACRGGGGGGGGGGGSGLTEVGTIEVYELELDTIQTDTIINCASSIWRQAEANNDFCNGTEVTVHGNYSNVTAAISRVSARGGICATIAQEATNLISRGRFRLHSGPVSAGDPVIQFVVINADMFGSNNMSASYGMRAPDMALVHEVQHVMGQGHDNTQLISGMPINYLTPNQIQCST